MVGGGRIERVEVTIDGGRSWTPALLQEPRVAAWRSRASVCRGGSRDSDARIASRAIDDTGYVQPTRDALVAVRGRNSIYHYNGIKVWQVRTDGTVTHADV